MCMPQQMLINETIELPDVELSACMHRFTSSKSVVHIKKQFRGEAQPTTLLTTPAYFK